MDKLLIRLIEQRAELAASALQHPGGRDGFEYGRVSGLHQGLTMAIEAVQEMLADREEDDT